MTVVGTKIGYEPTLKRDRKGHDYVKFSIVLPVRNSGGTMSKYLYVECIALDEKLRRKIMSSNVKTQDQVMVEGDFLVDAYGGKVTIKCVVNAYMVINKRMVVDENAPEVTNIDDVEAEVVKITPANTEIDEEDDFWG